LRISLLAKEHQKGFRSDRHNLSDIKHELKQVLHSWPRHEALEKNALNLMPKTYPQVHAATVGEEASDRRDSVSPPQPWETPTLIPTQATPQPAQSILNPKHVRDSRHRKTKNVVGVRNVDKRLMEMWKKISVEVELP